jgi:DNA polymerase phi
VPQVLETKESSPGTQDLFDIDESAGYTMEDIDGQSSTSTSSDAETLDSDIEQVSAKTPSSDEDADEELEDDQAELAAFDAKLAAALGTRKGQDHVEGEDTEGSDADMNEEDMDQDEMDALDEKLAEVFRARKPTTNKKQERKDTKEAIINFKRRVLDLVDVYLKQEHLNPFALDLVLPLIKTARSTSIKQVSKRAHDVLQEFCTRCRGIKVPAIDDKGTGTDEILGYLKGVHREAGLDNSGAHASACSRASILLVKVLIKAQINVGVMVDVYAETRKRQLLDLKCKVQPTFFTEWNNWCITARDQLAK